MDQTMHFQVPPLVEALDRESAEAREGSPAAADGDRKGYRRMGMLRPSAKVVTLRARPSGPKSSKIMIRSRPGLSGGTGNGYSRLVVTQSRPVASKAMFMGLLMSGSAATHWISKPGGSWKDFCSWSGVSGSVGRTFSAKGSAAWSRAATRAAAAQPKRRRAGGAPRAAEGRVTFIGGHTYRPNDPPSKGKVLHYAGPGILMTHGHRHGFSGTVPVPGRHGQAVARPPSLAMKWLTLQQLKSRRAQPRRQAVERLVAEGGAGAVDHLVPLAADPEAEVRRAV